MSIGKNRQLEFEHTFYDNLTTQLLQQFTAPCWSLMSTHIQHTHRKGL